jgi:hypothetical protein
MRRGERGRKKREENAAAAGDSLLRGGGASQGRGSRGWTPRGGREWGGERGADTAWDSMSGVAMAGSGPAAMRVDDVAWPRRSTGRTGEGEGADRWAAAIVPGGGTG